MFTTVPLDDLDLVPVSRHNAVQPIWSWIHARNTRGDDRYDTTWWPMVWQILRWVDEWQRCVSRSCPKAKSCRVPLWAWLFLSNDSEMWQKAIKKRRWSPLYLSPKDLLCNCSEEAPTDVIDVLWWVVTIPFKIDGPLYIPIFLFYSVLHSQFSNLPHSFSLLCYTSLPFHFFWGTSVEFPLWTTRWFSFSQHA